MIKIINLQFLISYLGLLPFLIIILDKFFFKHLNYYIVSDFIIIYSLIIFVFIGATNWNLKENISTKQTIIGFMPSLVTIFIILMYLQSFEVKLIIIILFIIQLLFDNFIFIKKHEKKIYLSLRLPLTLFIVLSLAII
tara:strand:- start:465 stop:878 length:414 start_codon:yes stop_codon:yes gene_type:complete